MTEARRNCGNCGAEISATTNFCPNCGAAQSPDPEVPDGPPPQTPEPGRISTPSDLSVPPPPPGAGGRSWGKILAIGCGILALLLLLLVGCSALIGVGLLGSSSTTAPESNSQEESKQKSDSKKSDSKNKGKAQGQESPASIGETVDVADATWYVISAEPRSQLEDQFGFGQAKQGNFVVVDFRFTNNGTEPKTLTQSAIALSDSGGRQFDPDTDTFSYIPSDMNIFFNQVNPGVTEEGQVIFSVAPGASGFTLELSNTNFLSDEKAYVDLGF